MPSPVVRLTGFPTRTFVDGQRPAQSGILFHVPATEQYLRMDGSTATVLRIELIAASSSPRGR